ncbi:MAG: chemotaxis-specific protein-glutamate methyltransferase CheB [Planctomycetota bacterium]
MRVAIVNDLAVACEALRRAVASDPSLKVAWTARDGVEAVEHARRDRPDVVLMDLIMPRMDGVEATRRIMRESPCPILVVTATVSGNSSLVYEALGAGALDAVNTPTLGATGEVAGAAELLRRIRRIGGVAQAAGAPSTPPAVRSAPSATLASHPASPRTSSAAPILAIGASTGGPAAIAAVLRCMPRDLAPPTLVVQHLAAPFVAGFAEWLAGETGRRVSVATEHALPEAGSVLIAGGDRHLVLEPSGRLGMHAEPADQSHRPSVDELFASLARAARPGVAVLLTGMGRDGAEGMRALRAAGWHTIAQDERTSVVWGMPGAAHRLGAATETLPLEMIGTAVAAALRATTAGGR